MSAQDKMSKRNLENGSKSQCSRSNLRGSKGWWKSYSRKTLATESNIGLNLIIKKRYEQDSLISQVHTINAAYHKCWMNSKQCDPGSRKAPKLLYWGATKGPWWIVLCMSNHKHSICMLLDMLLLGQVPCLLSLALESWTPRWRLMPCLGRAFHLGTHLLFARFSRDSLAPRDGP